MSMAQVSAFAVFLQPHPRHLFDDPVLSGALTSPVKAGEDRSLYLQLYFAVAASCAIIAVIMYNTLTHAFYVI